MRSPSTRQTEIAGLAELGLSNDEIAVRLRLSAELVRSELSEIYRGLRMADGDAARGKLPETAAWDASRREAS